MWAQIYLLITCLVFVICASALSRWNLPLCWMVSNGQGGRRASFRFPQGCDIQPVRIAMNLGGCTVPLLYACWCLTQITGHVGQAALALFLASLFAGGVSFASSRVSPRGNIRLPVMLPAFLVVGIVCLWLPPGDANRFHIGFIAAFLGPFIGADVLNLKRASNLSATSLHLGAQGVRDGLVLCPLIAALCLW